MYRKEHTIMKKVFTIFLVVMIIFASSMSGYAQVIIDEYSSPAALDDNYVLVHYYLASKYKYTETVDFSELIGTSSRSINNSSLYSEPYTPDNKVSPSSREVIGENNLTQVSNVTVAPYSKIVAIKIVLDSWQFYVSGVILGPDLVLTAAHCVYQTDWVTLGKDADGWANACYVYTEMAGYNNYYSSSSVTRITLPQEGYNGNFYYDWAYLTTSTNIGSTQGWMGFSAESPSDYVSENMSVTVAGYPAYPVSNGGGYMYTNQGNIIGLYDGEMCLRVSADSVNGMSGCPYFSSDQYVRAIHKSGDPIGSAFNIGTCITEEMFYILRSAKQAGIDKYS